MAERFDAVVVGAGPAGSTAARELAEAGARALVLERATLPRYKTCAGGVPLRTASLLPFAVDPVVEDRVTRMAVSLRGRQKYVRDARTPYAYMTMRARLDGFLAARAVEAGATIRDGVTVSRVEREGAAWRVVTPGGDVEARFLVGADGANSRVARDTGLGSGLAEGVALEAEVRAPDATMDRWRGTVGIDLGYRPSGYAWVFPKDEVLSLGIVMPKECGPALRERLDAYTRLLGLSAAPVDVFSGHKVLFRRSRTAIADGTALLVGDAAGLADELSEEGIYYAVRSGQMAAQAILAEPGAPAAAYECVVDGEIQVELDAARAIAEWVYRMVARFPLAVLLASQHIEYLWRALFKVQRGDSDYATELGRLPGPLRRAGALLAR